MFPLGDASRRLKHFPLVTLLIIAANGFVFLLELAGGDAFINQWSLVPADIVAGRAWITILTAMFMHAGWMHILDLVKTGDQRGRRKFCNDPDIAIECGDFFKRRFHCKGIAIGLHNVTGVNLAGQIPDRGIGMKTPL